MTQSLYTLPNLKQQCQPDRGSKPKPKTPSQDLHPLRRTAREGVIGTRERAGAGGGGVRSISVGCVTTAATGHSDVVAQSTGERRTVAGGDSSTTCKNSTGTASDEDGGRRREIIGACTPCAAACRTGR